MKNSSSYRILNNIIILGIVLTLLSLCALPLVITAYLKSGYNIVDSNLPLIMSIGIFICAVPYIVALFLLKKLCKQIVLKQPFSREIPKYLKQISICAFSEILIFNVTQLVLYYFFDIYLYGLTIVSAIIVSFISLAIGFLSMVLGKLFEMAIEIKEENDKTI
ncbi:MAG: DUF2975 domain-containing protein [Terrisporobacter sp.]